MENYRKSSPSRFDIKFHFVWVTKYRKRVLTGEVAVRLRDLVREVCRTEEIEILQGVVSGDHVHVLLSCPPNLAPRNSTKTTTSFYHEGTRRFFKISFVVLRDLRGD